MSSFFLIQGIPFLTNTLFGQAVPLPPIDVTRITEDDQIRLTEDDQERIV